MNVQELIFNQRAKHYTLVLDNGERFVLYEDALVAYDIRKGLELDEETLVALKSDNEVAKAVQYACSYLLNTPRTEKGIKDKFRTKGYTPDVAEKALQKLHSLGYIQDHQYAVAFVESSIRFKSPRAIRQKLQEKGIDKNMAEQVLAGYDDETQQEAAIKALIVKKAKQLSETDPKKRRDKLLRHILGKGYSYELTMRVYKRLEGNTTESEDHMSEREW